MTERVVGVIGAGGFLGATILEQLRLRDDTKTMAIVRSPHSFPMVARLADEIVVTRGSGEELGRALDRCDGVIDVSLGKPAEIVAAAETLVTAVNGSNVARVAYTSTAATIPVKRSPLQPPRVPSLYGRQKRRAEVLLEGAIDERPLAIFRPGIVWGPRSSWSVGHAYTLGYGQVVGPSGDHAMPPLLTYSENLAAALIQWVLGDEPSGAWFYRDPWWDTWEAFFCDFAVAIGLTPADVRLCETMAEGPLSARVREFLTDHPRVTKLGKGVVVRMPSVVMEAARGVVLSKPTPPPNRLDVAPGRAALSPSVDAVATFAPTKVDFFLRWGQPVPLYEHAPSMRFATKDEALRRTASWLSRTDHLAFLGLERGQQ